MRKLFAFSFSIVLLLFACASQKENQAPLVDIKKVNDSIILDIRYAKDNNFLGKAVYPAARCFFRQPVAAKLDSVQHELQAEGLGLKIFDGYRPYSVTKQMWQILPDDRYVANPKNGSRHNRGAAVDLTLVDSLGMELAMPTPFDDFSKKAGHDFQDLPANVIKNRNRLKQIMEKYGFIAIKTEWWHYDISNYMDYPILDLSFDEIESRP